LTTSFIQREAGLDQADLPANLLIPIQSNYNQVTEASQCAYENPLQIYLDLCSFNSCLSKAAKRVTAPIGSTSSQGLMKPFTAIKIMKTEVDHVLIYLAIWFNLATPLS
jgi:hypothetical protein